MGRFPSSAGCADQPALRLAARLLSWAACARVSGVTHTWSPGTASRHTYPCRQVSGPYAPPVGLRRLAARLLSWAACARVSGVTHTWSPGTASRHTYPCTPVAVGDG